MKSKFTLVSEWQRKENIMKITFVLADEEGVMPWFSMSMEEEEIRLLIDKWIKILAEK